jgi:hypothetical protein
MIDARARFARVARIGAALGRLAAAAGPAVSSGVRALDHMTERLVPAEVRVEHRRLQSDDVLAGEAREGQ